MEKLEHVIFLAILAVAVGGLFFFYTTGEATRTLKGCKGGATMQLTFAGLEQNTLGEYQFRGITGIVELLDISEGKAKLSVDGVETPYLGFSDIFLGEQVGVKMSRIDNRAVLFCLASSAPECVDYVWNLDAKKRVCSRWQSQADAMFY